MPEPKFNREHYKDQQEPSPNAQELFEHLDELRTRIIVAVVALLFTVTFAFCFSEKIILLLESASPQGSSFFQIKPGELFMVSLKVAVYSGLVLALPVILWQIYAFMKPGLKEHEAKIIQPLVIACPVLFCLGQVFAFYFILPAVLEFLFGFRKGVVETSYSLEHFLNLEISILSVSGISFLLPLVLLLLGFFGLVNSRQLIALWRYVVLAAFVISAIVTPTPDPLTMSILASALLSLYFLTVIILKLTRR